jgi:hypothetical protein
MAPASVNNAPPRSAKAGLPLLGPDVAPLGLRVHFDRRSGIKAAAPDHKVASLAEPGHRRGHHQGCRNHKDRQALEKVPNDPAACAGTNRRARFRMGVKGFHPVVSSFFGCSLS